MPNMYSTPCRLRFLATNVAPSTSLMNVLLSEWVAWSILRRTAARICRRGPSRGAPSARRPRVPEPRSRRAQPESSPRGRAKSRRVVDMGAKARGTARVFAIVRRVAHHGSRSAARAGRPITDGRERSRMPTHTTNHEWLELTREEPLDPALPICDPHHHLWDKVRGRVAPRYLLDEILEDVGGGHNVVSTVFIECGAMWRPDGPEPLRSVGETEFVNGIAAMSASGLYGPARVAAGIVGTAPLRIGQAVGAVLDAHIAAGGERFRGIRLGAAWDADPAVPNHRTAPPEHLLLRDDFRAGFAELGPRRLTFEAWCYHPQIPDVTSLARAFPDTAIILDHFGGPIGIGSYAGRAKDVHAEWQRSISELATCPNVVAKLGG